MTTISTTVEFDAWLAHAAHGDRAVYHVGELGRNRVELPDEPATPGLDALALAVLDAADRGEVAPLQSRLPDGKFEYTVTKGRFQRAMRLGKVFGAGQVQRLELRRAA